MVKDNYSWGVWSLEMWELRNGDGAWVMKDHFANQEQLPETDSSIRIRILIHKLEIYLSASVWYWILRLFMSYSRKFVVDEYDIICGGSKEENQSEFSLDFPEDIQEAFNVDIWTRLVTIV